MTGHFHISHINDVLPYVEGRKDFVVADKGDYTVIDYVFAGEDTFDHPARVECRGIKFAPDGSVLARPLHKFMNIGQAPDTQPDKIDFGQPHTITEKLDGSMIHPAIVSGEVVFMTRMGRTDVAKKAERHLTEHVEMACRAMLDNHITPIFEWTAPENRIVVRYDDSNLTLLAVRHNYSGAYQDRKSAAMWARDMGIPLVSHRSPSHTNAADFLAYARAIQGAEGFVVRFDNGLWVKAKGDDYVLKHRAKDSILQEKNILALVLNGGLDDVLPLLDEPDARAAREYAAAVEAGLAETAEELERRVAANSNLPQKEFALEFASELPALLQAPAYQVRRGANAHDVIRARIAANTNSQSHVDANRALHGARWSI
ncbi:RNA ligase [Pseudaminobacter sp. NGMCC 1.201702]|uniref:RNA ligase n=1 Tax=Pseudaminobacter sp. NGMCC 1.201702 TaxID=3391825 RepID=UPI0039F0DDEE